MVAANNFEEPNLSYVRVNQSTSPGTGESIKCHITKNMSPTDPAVVNSQLLHKSMVDQPIPQQLGSTGLWRPAHLYSEQEKAKSHFKFDTWEQLSSVSANEVCVVSQQTTVSASSKSSSNKRSFENVEHADPPNKRAKLSEPQDQKALLKRTQELEAKNARLTERNSELEQKMNIMTTIIKDPKKLAELMKRMQNLHKSCQTAEMAQATGTMCA